MTKEEEEYLAIGGAVFFDGPTSFSAESLQDFVVVAVFGQIVVPLRPKTGVYLGCNGSPSPLSPPVVLSLPPRRFPPMRRRRRCSVRSHSHFRHGVAPDLKPTQVSNDPSRGMCCFYLFLFLLLHFSPCLLSLTADQASLRVIIECANPHRIS